MKMKIVLIVHPIKGDVKGNLRRIRKIVKKIYKCKGYENIIPRVPYYLDLLTLDDNNATERLRGMSNTMEEIIRGHFDEVWVCGKNVTSGSEDEILQFIITNYDKPVIRKDL